MPSQNNRRIAKNTMMLYFRMLLIMVVSLYTSRVVLNTLGIEDFGIYNVVAGFVTMFGFLNSAMSRATQRFLAFEIGRKDTFQLRNVFSMSLIIHFLIAFIVFFFAETIGLWFVNNQLNIPQERMEAAKWVYQLSIFSLMVNIVSVPYNAIIIAHERMNVFAWVSIIEVSLKLLIVFILQWFGFDKLKFYAILMFSISLLIRLIYGKYCENKFKESRFRWLWDKTMFRTLLSFAGWSFWGSLASVLAGQGTNILLNIFFGPVVNAARGIAYQVRGAIASFSQNFQMAVNPQIIKNFANNDIKYMHLLIFQSAKFSFFLLFLFSLPILLETETILKLWLKIVPEHTIIFTQLIIINILIEGFFEPLNTAAHATGKIKFYQGVVSGLLLLSLPTSFIFFKMGFKPEITLIISIFYSTCTLFARLLVLKKLINIEILDFIKEVILRVIVVSMIALIFPFIIHLIFSEGIFRFLLVSVISIISLLVTVYLIGLKSSERLYLKTLLKERNKKFKTITKFFK